MTPRLRLTLSLLLLLAAGVCLRLGVWQRGRLLERRARNAVALARREAPPVDLDRDRWTDVDSLAGRRVTVRGRFDQPHSLVIRARVYNDIPGVEVVTPLLRDSGAAVLVNRGFIPAADALTAPVDSFTEPGPVAVEGVALPLDSLPDSGAPVTTHGRTTWSRVDRAAARRLLPYPSLPLVVVRRPVPDTTGWPRRVEAPGINDGPHFNYMLQWFGFGTMALIMAGLMAFQRADGPPPP